MPDFGAPVTANYTAPDGLATLGNLMSLRQKQQGLQSQQLEMAGQQSQNQSFAAKAQTDTRVSNEQAKLAQIPWDTFEKEDGSYDVDAARKMAMRVAPTTGAEFAQRLNETTKGAAETKQAFQSLALQQQQGIRSSLGTWGADPKAPLSDLLTQAEAAKANAPDATRAQLSKVVDHAVQAITGPNLVTGQPKTPQEQKAAAVGFSRAGLSNAEVSGPQGLATPQNVNVDSGAQIQPSVQAPALAGGGITPAGPPIRKGIAPVYLKGPNESVLRADDGGLSTPKDKGGAAPPKTPPGKLQPITRPGINAPRADQDNYNSQIAAAGEEYKGVSSAANDPQNGVQVSRYRNGQIMQLTKIAPTGPGKDIWNHIASQLPGKTGDAFQTIGHYLAQNSAAMAGKMGVPNTNMGQATAAAAAGNQTQNPQTIAEITRVNDALNTGFDLYNRGLAKVTNNGSDMSKVPAFKQAFGANVDVNALRYADATRRGDKEELEQLKAKLGDSGIDKLKQKLVTLKTLVTSGDLP